MSPRGFCWSLSCFGARDSLCNKPLHFSQPLGSPALQLANAYMSHFQHAYVTFLQNEEQGGTGLRYSGASLTGARGIQGAIAGTFCSALRSSLL